MWGRIVHECGVFIFQCWPCGRGRRGLVRSAAFSLSPTVHSRPGRMKNPKRWTRCQKSVEEWILGLNNAKLSEEPWRIGNLFCFCFISPTFPLTRNDDARRNDYLTIFGLKRNKNKRKKKNESNRNSKQSEGNDLKKTEGKIIIKPHSTGCSSIRGHQQHQAAVERHHVFRWPVTISSRAFFLFFPTSSIILPKPKLLSVSLSLTDWLTMHAFLFIMYIPFSFFSLWLFSLFSSFRWCESSVCSVSDAHTAGRWCFIASSTKGRNKREEKQTSTTSKKAHQIEEEEKWVEWKRTSDGAWIKSATILLFFPGPSTNMVVQLGNEDAQFPTDCDVVRRAGEWQRATGTSGRIVNWRSSCQVDTIGRYDVNTAKSRQVEHRESRKRRPNCCWMLLVWRRQQRQKMSWPVLWIARWWWYAFRLNVVGLKLRWKAIFLRDRWLLVAEEVREQTVRMCWVVCLRLSVRHPAEEACPMI